MRTPLRLRRALDVAALAVLLFACAGCATTGATLGDPYEGVNRQVYAFNETVDEAVLKPLAKGYQTVVPDFIDLAVSSFFNNIKDVQSALNNLLQMKLTDAFEDAGRVAINSTMGLAGLVYLASGFGIHRHDEDFGQTLGYWGVEPGSYLVLPFLGPSSVRDTIGTGVDFVTDPLFYINSDILEYSLKGVRGVDRRADLLSAEKVVGAAALDEYSFVRDAYLQRRRNQVYDGDPPPEEE